MTSTERFFALLGSMGSVIVFLATITYRLGQLVQRFNDLGKQFGEHVKRSDHTHEDFDRRIWEMQGRRR